jgi:hypothetical protein
MPKKRTIQELKRVYFKTNQTLDLLLKKNGIENPVNLCKDEELDKMTPEDLRKRMANDHNIKVKSLIVELGQKKAIEQGRIELLKTGIKLGERARLELGVRDSISDFLKAAKILYKILGIDIEIKRLSTKEIIMFVNRCSLSYSYIDVTCQVLSATDEGMVQGLNSNFKMAFQERITSGATKCRAEIKIMEN